MQEERDQEERDPIVEKLVTRMLPDVVTGLTGLKMKVLGARRRLPQSYPELTSGGPEMDGIRSRAGHPLHPLGRLVRAQRAMDAATQED